MLHIMVKKNKNKKTTFISVCVLAILLIAFGIFYLQKIGLVVYVNSYAECAKNFPEGVLVKGSDPAQYECTTPGGNVFTESIFSYAECAEKYPEGVIVLGSNPAQYKCTTPGGNVFIDSTEFEKSFQNN